jgi:hypothetical protein
MEYLHSRITSITTLFDGEGNYHAHYFYNPLRYRCTNGHISIRRELRDEKENYTFRNCAQCRKDLYGHSYHPESQDAQEGYDGWNVPEFWLEYVGDDPTPLEDPEIPIKFNR